ncbi:hypothetical protein MMC14_009551 [Varicellaria rhodocarpa]|nr:hypothetical protein [Varicellaria rhodocarpa]
MAKRESTASFKGPLNTYTNTQTAPSKRQNIIEIDCRGLEFTDFKADGKWKAKGLESKSRWDDIEFDEDGEWFDYDDKTQEEVSIKAKFKVERS